uniref:ribbon-helix-helix domain-containing protein n=1 Tax=uncultured Sphingomonas sp. TaxID=158754 RepID=UPI0035C96301
MAQMHISVSDDASAWAERRVADGDFANTSDYLVDLIRRDQERVERLTWLRAEVEKGFASGVSSRSLQDILAQHRASRAAA